VDTDHNLAIIAILAFSLIIFLLTMAETALLSCRPARLEKYAEKLRETDPDIDPANISRRIERAESLLDQSTRIVTAVQILVVLLSLSEIALAVGLFASPFAHILSIVHIHHPFSFSVIILVVVIAFLTLVVGQIIPRAIAERHPEALAYRFAKSMKWLLTIEAPLIGAVLGASNLLLKPMGIVASFSTPIITEEELATLLETSRETGVIEQEEKEMLRNVISFGDTLVHEVMTPRIDIKSAEVNTPITKLVNLIVDCGHSRIPLYEGTVDNIVGIIHAKDLLPALATGNIGINLRSMMRRIGHVPENKPVDELLTEFRRSKSQIVVVQDEYGGTAGLVTVEDLLEEIVGEIQDEYDVEQPRILRDENGRAEVDARLRIDDVNDEIGLNLASEDFDTIGGFETIEYGDLIFTITQADGRRVYRLAIEKRQEEADESDGSRPADAV